MKHPATHDPNTRPDDDEVTAALAHLASAGIPVEALTSSDVDVTDPASLRGAVDQLLLAAVSGEAVLNDHQLLALEEAYRALNQGAGPVQLRELGNLIDSYITVVAGRPVIGLEPGRRYRPEEHFGDRCLEAD
jgi:hypothetical protein